MLYGWKENSMLTNCLAACAHLTITVSEIQRDICEKIVYFIIPPLHSTGTPRSRRNISTPFGIEKLEWCRYPIVQKIRRYVYLFWRDPRTWRTDGRTDTAWQHRPRGKKTSSSAVAEKPREKPRDVSCPSEVSFSSTIPRAPSVVLVTSASDLQLNSVLFSSTYSSMW